MSFLGFNKARLQKNIGERYEKLKNQDMITKIYLIAISIISVILLISYKTLFFVIISVLLWGLFFLLDRLNGYLKNN
jgi:uncharacterized membrane protein YiaA